jgi:hypothetical protein
MQSSSRGAAASPVSRLLLADPVQRNVFGTARPGPARDQEPPGDAQPLCFTRNMANPMLDTASQRPPTGLDAGARKLILQVLDRPPAEVLALFFLDRFANIEDYFVAVERVWGVQAARSCRHAVADTQSPVTIGRLAANAQNAAALALLLAMPEPDFRLAISMIFDRVRGANVAGRITDICKARGAPWKFDLVDGFVWIGDEEIESKAIVPALSAIADRRFAGGVRQEFESARGELALGTPAALSKCLQQSGCAVESAMKITLDEHGITYPATATAQPLFDHLETAGIVPRSMEKLVLAASTPRNKKGGHGAGAVAHVVAIEEAEAVFANSAVAIAYLHERLP